MKWTTSVAILIGYAVMSVSLFLYGEEKKKQVIDLGTLEVQGKLRGPEIQLIESNQMGAEALLKLSRLELKKLETELLKVGPFPSSAKLRNQEPVR
jgi:hypothetical protein